MIYLHRSFIPRLSDSQPSPSEVIPVFNANLPAVFMDSRFPAIIRKAGLVRGGNADFQGIATLLSRAENFAAGGAVTIEVIESTLAIFPPRQGRVLSSTEPSRRYA